jgi:hypothetical protein
MKYILLCLLVLSGCRANPNDGFGLTFTPGGGGSTNTGPVIGHVSVKLNLPTASPNRGLYIWVTTTNNIYVNTIQRYLGQGSGKTGDNPTVWKSYAGSSSLDGVTSASVKTAVTSYQSASWNCKDKTGADVPFGTYKVWLEICQDNSTTHEYNGTILIMSNTNTIGTLTNIDSVMAAGTNQFTTN